ncbi:alpha-L-fucosidase [Siphonobacter aquaeclarae]|uniref:alpha-L-fucosidase n=1 Tax=Siphonobacter aquaeclarae TaxID=563176 RepID=A0A1G9SHV3_9BACT|nr:alpha-L-fucosidase [Siphonobacter aquaeclarae]SDM35009.1 alpha-L-fucosidase [Siphonobacter aquaeclarae]
MKRILFLLLLAASASAQSYQPAPENLEARKWFQDARYGLFIHWGVYSILGDGEWVMNNQNITVPVYEKLPRFFNPTAFDAKKWVQVAKSAGMKYITITSKHHDGFAMWHSKVSKYNIVDATPYGKDVLKALADECEKEGIKLFFYHSHLDWHSPDYFPRGKTGRNLGRPESGDFDKYLQYMDAQLTELLSGQYGKIAGIWFDGWWDQAVDEHEKNERKTNIDWKLRRTYDLIHKLQPAALIGNNHHVTPFEGEDFQMFERDLPGQNQFGYNTSTISQLPLETCETLNGAWGFELKDQRYKSPEQIVRYLVNAAGRNANLLLNVGPMPNGEIQPEFVERLAAAGKWLQANGETIYGTRGGIVPPQDWGVSTRKGDGLHYFHILKKPATSYLFIPNVTAKIGSIQTYEGKKPLKFKQQPEGLFVYLDGISTDNWDTILEVRTK